MAEERRVFLLTRRLFCGGVATCAAVGLAGCALEGDGGVVGTGPLDEDGGARPDGGAAGTPDARPGPPDAAVIASNCPSGAVDLGAPTRFAMGTATLFSSQNVFVCHDSGGLYALSSRCTHQHCTLQAQSTRFHCACHNGNFDLNGGIVSGPIVTPLKHYLLCYNSAGDVAIDLSQTVTASTRLTVA